MEYRQRGAEVGIARVAIVSAGVDGAGWAARLVQNRLEVVMYASGPDDDARVRAVLRTAARAHARLTLAPPPPEPRIRFARTLAEAVDGADLIVESCRTGWRPKREVLAGIERAARQDALVASSTSAFAPSDLQAGMRHPGRLLVAHAIDPVYLLPAVEVVGGARTDAGAIEQALAFYRAIGMTPIHLARESEGLVGDRLLASIRREASRLVRSGVCTADDLDDVVRHGFGLRFAQMGPFEIGRITGGDAATGHAPTDVPDPDEGGEQPDSRDLARIRDDNLVAILQALRATDWGAGAVLAEHERRLFDAAATGAPAPPDPSRPLRTTERCVPLDWTDYNGHMNEARYLQAFADATDALLRTIGCDADYLAAGGSYFTVETHIRHLGEVRATEPFFTETQVIAGAGKKLHLFHWLRHGDGRLLATGEHLLIHVSLETRAASEPGPQVATGLARLAAGHARLPVPDGLGRAVAQPR